MINYALHFSEDKLSYTQLSIYLTRRQDETLTQQCLSICLTVFPKVQAFQYDVFLFPYCKFSQYSLSTEHLIHEQGVGKFVLNRFLKAHVKIISPIVTLESEAEDTKSSACQKKGKKKTDFSLTTSELIPFPSNRSISR